MINNTNLVRDLLKFESDQDFYFLQILKRRKDNPTMERDMEIVDNFFIYSAEDFQNKLNRIISVCNKHNARAYIRLNRRNLQKAAIMTMKKVADLIVNEDFKAVKSAYTSAIGESHSEPFKRWIVDVDTHDESHLLMVKYSIIHLHNIIGKGEILAIIPTKAGYHIICNPFNVQEFRKSHSEDIHKDNPTILYVP